DLSYNNLTGTVPQFLASLDNLKLLNLTGNNFTRPHHRTPSKIKENLISRLLFNLELTPIKVDLEQCSVDLEQCSVEQRCEAYKYIVKKRFQAKRSNFGFKLFTTEDATDESTRIVGTLGYLDPE
ncbi:leucine-rich repeat transmembrane protein kinase protein, partial [Tanacetum coccineum]